MRILVCHNFYQEAGGEDQVYADESSLLENNGHEVIRYTRHNNDIRSMGSLDTARKTIFNRTTVDDLRKIIDARRPEVIHCHNTFPLISPAAYTAARAAGVPVVQTLHNYRLLCPSALFLRNGAACEDCLGKLLAWPGVLHGCYRGDRNATAVVATMLAWHRLAGTWTRDVAKFIALSEFSRQKFVQGGLPLDKLVVKTNFMPCDPGRGAGRGQYAMFVGRLSTEKGIGTLLEAWRTTPESITLKIVGDGPLAGEVAAAANPRIEYLGRRPSSEVLELLGGASFLVLPSVCYENCPKTILESFAKGTPVIVPRIGALNEMVEDGRNGFKYSVGNAADLVSAVQRFAALDESQVAALRRSARCEYELKYAASQHLGQLLNIYDQAIKAAGRSPVTQPVAEKSNVGKSSKEKKPRPYPVRPRRAAGTGGSSVATKDLFPQRILVCHNFYQQAGGEDQVFFDECALLESRGHEVFRFTLHNDAVSSMSKLAAARTTIYNADTYHAIRKLIAAKQIDLVHCHNTFPLISPSIYQATNDEGVPIVQTLHNFRLLCPSALLLRNGRPCEDCVGKLVAWPGILHACYRDNRAATTAVAAMLFNHKMRGTWQNRVQAYIALSEFARRKFIAGGLPAEKLATAPNFIMGDPGPGNGRGGFALFVGRLSREKGIQTVIDAWQRIKSPMELRIVGDGPLSDSLQKSAASLPRVQFLGRLPSDQVLSLMGQAACLLMPSVWYENCPKTILESFAKGTPVVASRIGALEEMIADGHSGLHFQPGDPDDLARAIERFATYDEGQVAAMRYHARMEYEQKYTADNHYPQLIDVYRRAKAGVSSAANRSQIPIISNN